MTDMAEIFVPIVAIGCMFGLPVIAFIVFRYLAHRERMEMIRHGLVPTGGSARDWRAAAAAQRPRNAPDFECEDPQRILRKGVRLACIGFALLIGLSFIGVHEDSLGMTHFHPGPWLLGGLIPLFVGLAQVATALLSGATLGQLPLRTPPPEPAFRADSAQAGGNSAPTFDQPYAYRPGPAPELRAPAQPPAPPDRT
jgi:hypothetical protein